MDKKLSLTVTTSISLLLCIVMVTAFTCSQNQQQKAAKFADAYAQSLKAIHDATDSALVSGKLTPAEIYGIHQNLLRANEAGLHLNAAIRAVAKSEGSVAGIQAAIAEAQKAIEDGTAAIKNPVVKAEVQAIASTSLTILGQIGNLYAQGGKR